MNKSISINRKIRDVNQILLGMSITEKFIDIDARPELRFAIQRLRSELEAVNDQVDVLRKKHFTLDDISEEDYQAVLRKLDDISKKCYLVKFPYESVKLPPIELQLPKKESSKSTLAYIFDSIPSLAWIMLAYGAMWRLSTPSYTPSPSVSNR